MPSNIRTFSDADQRWFARVTGDANPLHLDAEWAAARFPGEPVVHGSHVFLWGLDRYLAVQTGLRIGSVQATFLKPVLIGDEVRAETTTDGSLRLLVRGEVMVAAHVYSRAGSIPTVADGPLIDYAGQGPRNHSAERLLGFAGAIAVPDCGPELAAAFPSIHAAIEPPALVGLAAVSTLVGMACPGLHSMLSEISLSPVGLRASGPLAFRVTRHAAAFSRVQMEVCGLGVGGSVSAFAGQDAPSLPGTGDFGALISASEFAGQQPLVIGGSNGLGAATVRLLAAGGADVTLTWHRSRDAAAAVARTASTAESPCQLIHLDVTSPADGLTALANAGWRGGQLYYFASPRIFRRRLEAYQRDDLQDFFKIYVDGFYEVVRSIMNTRHDVPLAIFYPSSAAIDEFGPDLFEYRIAKLAGEELCARLQERYRSLTITVTRLPRVTTRQTQTSLRAQSAAPEMVMSGIVKKVQRSVA